MTIKQDANSSNNSFVDNKNNTETLNSLKNRVAITTISELKTGKIVFASQALAEQFGSPLNEIIGKTGVEIGLLSEKQRAEIAIELQYKGEIRGKIITVNSKSGRIGYALLNAVVVKNNISGLILSSDDSLLISNVINVTDLVDVKTKLVTSESKYQLLFDHMSCCCAIYKAIDNGENFIFIDFNSAAEKVEHIKKEHLIGKSIYEIFPAVKEFGLLDVIKRVYSSGTPEHFPLTLYKDSRISGWRNNFVYKLPSGEIVTIYNDLSDAKKLEEDINNQFQNYHQIQEGIAILRKQQEAQIENRYNVSNVKASGIYDILDQALEMIISVTKSEFGFIQHYDEEKQIFSLNSWSKSVMKECLVTEKLTTFQLQNCGFWGEAVRQRKEIIVNDFKAYNPLKKGCPAGHVPIHKFLAVPLIMNGRIIAVTALANKSEDYNKIDAQQVRLFLESIWPMIDHVIIGEQNKQLESLLMQSSKLADIGLLASGIVHEINNPLAIMRGNLDLLQYATENLYNQLQEISDNQQNSQLSQIYLPIKKKTDDYFNKSLLSYQRCFSIINQLKNLYRHKETQFEAVDLHCFVQETVDFAKTIITKSKYDITIELKAIDHEVYVDKGKLNQVILNMLNNAQEAFENYHPYTQPQNAHTPHIRIESKSDPHRIFLQFFDNGPGISQEDLQNIFNPFFTSKDKGTGLGLYISREIIRSFNGQIYADSKPNYGTTFTIELPLICAYPRRK
ncbi:MAG: GAF domain-containing protein [Oligoflexia bacterium]|nr:GAF domain-containing protein [Oligoflexia bacterium]